MNIGDYTVSNTRDAMKREPDTLPLHRLRIRKGGVLLCEVYPAKLDPDRIGWSDPYRFVLQYPQSSTRRSVVRQLQENGVPKSDIDMLLQMSNRETYKNK